MTPKKPYESKTIVIGAILGMVGAVSAFYPQANAISAWINANGGAIAAIWSVLAVALRFATKSAIQLGD